MLLILGSRVEDHIKGHQDVDPEQTTIGAESHPTLSQPASADIPSQLALSALDSRSSYINQFEQVRFQEQPSDSTSSLFAEVSAQFTHSLRPTSDTPGSRFGWPSPTADPGLPPYEALCSLVDLYFKHVNTWCPILDRNTIFDTLFKSMPPNEPDRILFHAIVVTSLRFSKELRLTPEAQKKYYSISKQKVQLYGLENTNVRALQALVIISLDALGTSNGPQGWNLLALIARNITQLGLGVDKKITIAPATYPSSRTLNTFSLPQAKSWIEDEERRRLFWMVYILDRYATIDTPFEFVLNEKQTGRALPCRYDLFSKNQPVETRWLSDGYNSKTSVNKPENLGSFSHHCEVLRILSRIQRFLNTPVDIESSEDVGCWQTRYWELDGELESWSVNLPDEYGKISQFCHSDPNSKISNWIILHAAYITTVLRLHSAAAYPSVNSHIFKPSFNAMQRCLAAVASLREIALDVIKNRMLDLLGPSFAFSLWVAARLLIVHATIAVVELDPNIGFFINTLDQVAQHWPVAQKYTSILNRLLNDCHSADQVGSEGAFLNVRTLARMRRLVRQTCSPSLY